MDGGAREGIDSNRQLEINNQLEEVNYETHLHVAVCSAGNGICTW
jgi:hypothetical protein